MAKSIKRTEATLFLARHNKKCINLHLFASLAERLRTKANILRMYRNKRKHSKALFFGLLNSKCLWQCVII